MKSGEKYYFLPLTSEGPSCVIGGDGRLPGKSFIFLFSHDFGAFSFFCLLVQNLSILFILLQHLLFCFIPFAAYYLIKCSFLQDIANYSVHVGFM